MNEVENLKLAAGANKPPVGIVPLHPLLGLARVFEDSGVKYAPFNYMAQSIADACESYTSAELRHHIASTILGGQVTPESLATLDADSGLPHIFHRIAGLFILATLMIRDGIIPLDPGPGKRKQAADAHVEQLRADQAVVQRAIDERRAARVDVVITSDLTGLAARESSTSGDRPTPSLVDELYDRARQLDAERNLRKLQDEQRAATAAKQEHDRKMAEFAARGVRAEGMNV